jgi:flagellar motor switch protein FliG
MVSLDPETAARLMGQLEKSEQEHIAVEIVRLEASPPDRAEREKVLREFLQSQQSLQQTDQGGLRSVQTLLEKVHPPQEARRMLESVSGAAGKSRFEFLRKADPENIVHFIVDEHPQMIALILSHLDPVQSGRILEGLPLAKQQEVVRRLASLEPTSPQVVQQVEKALESRLSTVITQDLEQADGIGAAARVLNQVQRSVERAILEGLKAEEPEMVDRIRRLMFTFADLLRVNDRGVQNLLKNVDTTRLALALKTAKPELRDKLFRNMSQRAVARIQEEMELMGPVRLADVEAAQQAVVDETLRLEEAGELVIEGRGGAQEAVVA